MKTQKYDDVIGFNPGMPHTPHVDLVNKRQDNCEISEDDLEFNCSSGSINDLILYINNYFNLPYIVDKTNYTEKISVDINVFNLIDLSALRKQLEKYDLDVIETTFKRGCDCYSRSVVK